MVEEIRKLREVGVVRCGYIERAATLMEVAQEFSLNDDNAHYRTINKIEAVEILTRILHKDMAYECEIMPMKTARSLAAEFIRQFQEGQSRFYTNIDFGTEKQTGPNSWAGPQWNPVTDGTFDAGVIAIGSKRAACLWVEDED